ncbi:hypothetical protein WKN18_003562 [Vibrio cholerae]|nr:hypothetical protein [Vibrio cholerae]
MEKTHYYSVSDTQNWASVTYDLKNLVIVMYLIIPTLFYGIPYLYSIPKGGVLFNFYGTQFIHTENLLEILLGHLLVGLLVCFVLLKNNFKLDILSRKSRGVDLLMILVFIINHFIPSGIVSMVCYPLFLFMFIRRTHYTSTLIFILAISMSLVFLDGVRYALVQSILLISLPLISRLSITKLLISSFAVVLFLVFVLQPLRSGSIPFAGESVDLSYLIQHLQPIYLGANTTLSLEASALRMLSESIPFLKSILGYESIIDSVSKLGLSKEAYDNGTRYGSNSSMYFNTIGYLILIAFFMFFRFISEFFKSKLLQSAMLVYFITYGIYFIRRSIGSYFVDLFMMFVVFWVFITLLSLFGKLSQQKQKMLE